MFRLTKNYQLLRFLNRSPGPVIRAGLSGLGWLATLTFTGNRVLAADMNRSLRTDPNLKHCLRRLAWYGARSPFRIEPIEDPVFDFAAGRDCDVLNAQSTVAARSGNGGIQQQLDQLTILAAYPHLDWDALSDAINGVLAMATGPQPTLVQKIPAPRTGDFQVTAAGKALSDFAQLFPNTDIPWYVISGTFLGLIREDGFLRHDYDIDLGIHAETIDLSVMIDKANNDQRFTVTDIVDQVTQTRDTKMARPILFKLVHQDGVHIDVFVHYAEAGLRWHGSNVHRWDNSAFDLTPYTLSGTPVLGPADADRYLTENYGDWRTPVTDFNPSFGTPNLRVVQNVASLVLCLKRYALARQAGLAIADDITDRLLAEGYLTLANDGLRFDPTRFDRPVDDATPHR